MYFRFRFESDAHRKKRLEQCILLLYQKNIDSILSKKKVLLPPPPPEKAFGEYELGTIVYDDKEICPFGLREKEFLRHTGIFGITGTGKSNIVFKLIDELLKKDKHIFILDWKAQYRDLLSIRQDADVLIFGVGNKNIPTFQFNPLIPPPHIEPSQYLEFVCQIVASSYYVGEGVISLLRQAISELYDRFNVNSGNVAIYPTFKEVLDYIKTIERKGRSRDWQESTIRSLHAICSGGLSEIVNVQKPTMQISELLSKNVFLELGELSESQKKFVIQSLLTYLYYYSMHRGEREKLRNIIICEEAHHILRDTSKSTVKEPITDIIIKEIREFGTGIILVDQNPSLISVPALSNNYCTIGLYTKHGADISALSRAMFLSDDQKECLGKLECGTGIVKLAGRIFEPFLVKFPLMNIKKGTITDRHVMEHMAKRGYYSKISGYSGPSSQTDKTSKISKIINSAFDDLKIFQGHSAHCCQNHPISPDDEFNSVSFTDGDEANKDRFGRYSADSAQAQDIPSDPKIFHPIPTKDEIEKMAIWLKDKWIESGDGEDADNPSPIKDFNKDIISENIIKDIRLYPFDGISLRAKRLKISHRKCNDVISRLESENVLKRVEIKEKSGRRVLFEISGFDYSLGGIEHRFWNNAIAELNRQAGYVVEIEKKIDGNGYIDQVISKNKKMIAIEIETGKSTPIETIVHDLSLGFDKVISVATNEQAYNMIKENLIKTGLSTDGRIFVILSQNFSCLD